MRFLLYTCSFSIHISLLMPTVSDLPHCHWQFFLFLSLSIAHSREHMPGFKNLFHSIWESNWKCCHFVTLCVCVCDDFFFVFDAVGRLAVNRRVLVLSSFLITWRFAYRIYYIIFESARAKAHIYTNDIHSHIRIDATFKCSLSSFDNWYSNTHF